MKQVQSEMEDVEVISEEQYHLVAVISHHGSNITSGHYTACVLRNGQWYSVNDSQVSKISDLTAMNQEAYILMYERNDSKINKSAATSNPRPKQSSFEILESTPPNYYVDCPSTSYCLPRVCRTERSKEGLVYTPVSELQVKHAKLQAHEDQDPPPHLRLKGYSSSDLLSLLPGSWLNNFVLNNYMWIIENKCKASGNNVWTINSDVFQNMITASMEIFKSNQYHKIYDDILLSNVILGAVNFSNHWCLVATFPQLRMMMYLDSLYQGASGRQSFQRMQHFLECSQRISNPGSSCLDWKECLFYILPSQHLSQQTNGDDCGVFVAKWAQHISLGLPLDFTQADIESFRYSMILEISAGDPRLEIELPPHEHELESLHHSRPEFPTDSGKKKQRETPLCTEKLCSKRDLVYSDDDFQPPK